jgi:hypothetical protein
MAEQSGGISQSGKRVSPVEMQKHLKGVNYPASKDDLVKRGATGSREIVQIRTLPGNSYNGQGCDEGAWSDRIAADYNLLAGVGRRLLVHGPEGGALSAARRDGRGDAGVAGSMCMCT